MKRKNFDEISIHQFVLFVHKEQKKLVKKFVKRVWDEFFDFIFVSKVINTCGFRQKKTQILEKKSMVETCLNKSTKNS